MKKNRIKGQTVMGRSERGECFLEVDWEVLSKK